MIRLSRAQVREVDRIAIEEYGIPGIVLMENAARSAVEAICSRYEHLEKRLVGIACGPGNNGGDGFAIARLLSGRGIAVRILTAGSTSTVDSQTNAAIVDKIPNIKVRHINEIMVEDLLGCDMWIDAMFGTGLTRPLAEPWIQAVHWMNESSHPIVAIDLPSGLDCDTGEPLGDACVKADLTVTFVAEKLGFANPKSKHYTGEIVVGDIGCPREIIDRVMRDIPHPS